MSPSRVCRLYSPRGRRRTEGGRCLVRHRPDDAEPDLGVLTVGRRYCQCSWDSGFRSSLSSRHSAPWRRRCFRARASARERLGAGAERAGLCGRASAPRASSCLVTAGALRCPPVSARGWSTFALADRSSSTRSTWGAPTRRAPRLRSAFQAGVQSAFYRFVAGSLPVVAVGKSFGGSAVFYYAGSARAWHVPAPAAILSIFPAGPIGALPVAAGAADVLWSSSSATRTRPPAAAAQTPSGTG